MSPPRVAVVGVGPRGLYAWERLVTLGRRHGSGPARLDLFHDGALLGVSDHYQPNLPPYLRLNVDAGSVDAWDAQDGEAPAGPSFDAWREACASGSSRDAFPPRREVGRYLSHMADRLTALSTFPVRHHRIRVVAADVMDGAHAAGRWRLTAADGSVHGPFDEVLLAPGHAPDWPGALHHDADLGRECLPPYPGADDWPLPEGTVVVRGAALTALDVALHLTEGAGGRFEPAHDPHRPWRLVYHPPRRGARIVLVSRTGRLMAPKTLPSVLNRVQGSAGIAEQARAQVPAEVSDLPGLLVPLAAGLLVAAAPDRWSAPAAAAEARRVWRDCGDGPPHTKHRPIGPDPEHVLSQGLDMATGLRSPNGDWAMGQAWRALYPALVAWQRRVALDRHAPLLGDARAAGWAAQLERLAFGPPPVNAAKLAALLAAGTVEVRAGDAAATAVALGAGSVVDAVLAPPGVRGVDDPLWTELLSTGRVGAGSRVRGVRIDADANCLDTDDRPVAGLSAAGRVTEDVVMGNDTLVRMHPELDRWARRVLGLSDGSGPSATPGRTRPPRSVAV